MWIGDGTSPLSLAAYDQAPTCEHEVEIVGLSPDTAYRYAIGSAPSEVLRDDAALRFVTAPAEGGATTRPIRAWVLGDAGRGGQVQESVRDAYEAYAAGRHTDLWLMLGDNAYEDGTYDQYMKGVFEMYPDELASSVLWPTIGNHDGRSVDPVGETGPYYELFTVPKRGEGGGLASGTSSYYSFDFGNIHFATLDTDSGDTRPGGKMLDWLERDLAASDKEWKVVFFHHPPYTKGSHDSDREHDLVEVRRRIVPLLERAGADLVLSGHSHSYERSYPVLGHYGPSWKFEESMKVEDGPGFPKPYSGSPGGGRGAVYVVAGTSGRADPLAGAHPVMCTSLSVPGSLVLDVDGAVLRGTFLDHGGNVLDRFELSKG